MTKEATKTIKNKTLPKSENLDFPIVGIGTSAGGLEALEKFFQNLQKNNESEYHYECSSGE